MKKFITAVAVVAAMTTPVAFAHQNFGHGHNGARAELASKLNLTDAQKQQIRDIKAADREANKALFQQFRVKRQELRTLRQNNDPNFEAAKAELTSIGQQLRAARKATHEKIYNTVLTADQRAIVDQARAERQGRRK
jgi:Spy/CpxP family protein refolding chaperone